MSETDSLKTSRVVRWLLGITRPVHGPLSVSLLFRILNLVLDVLLFGTVAGGAIALVQGGQGKGAYSTAIVVLSLLKAAAFR